MPHKQLVTIGTDGLSDWVQTPDGVKHMLGPISVLKFVTELGTGGAHAARKTLDEFIKGGTSMLTIDPDRMWELLKPHRARWTSANPSIPTPIRTPSSMKEGRTEVRAMADIAEQSLKDAITNQVARIEAQIATLQTNVKEASPGSITQDLQKKQIDDLKDMVAFLRRPSVYGNQSDNSSYYGLPEKTVSGESARTKEAAVHENMQQAQGILNMLKAADEKIDKLVLAGKKFDAGRAKADLHKVAANVKTVVAHPKFKDADRDVIVALYELGKSATQIHGLFATAKV